MQPWVELYHNYLFYITSIYGGPGFQQGALLGPLLSPTAGGFIAKRSVQDWLYGAAPQPFTGQNFFDSLVKRY